MNKPRKRKPAETEQGREHQLVSLAVDLAEQQLIAGTASSQVITHYLKLGSTREKLEQERLHRENLLLDSKVEAMASAQRIEEMYGKALEAMRSYAGQEVGEFEDDQDLQ
jgi:hypothetical protein